MPRPRKISGNGQFHSYYNSDSPRRQARNTSQEHWTVDKKIPIALIITLIIQAAAIIGAWNDLYSRVKVLETEQTAYRNERESTAKKLETLPALQAGIMAVSASLERLERRLEKIVDRHEQSIPSSNRR